MSAEYFDTTPSNLSYCPQTPLDIAVSPCTLTRWWSEHILRQQDDIPGSPVKQTQRERAYQHIRRKLAEGALPAGVRLSPAALAREIGVSHIPVREAISQLRSEGLIVHMAHRGAFVKGADRQDLVDLIELRTVLECHAAARAAPRISAAQVEELQERSEALCRLAEAFRVPPGTDLREPLGQWLLGDLALHTVLLRAAEICP